jgi:chlorophyll a/b binding light-harvesting protein
MQTYGSRNVDYGWWAGNSRFADRTGLWLAAHVAQASFIVLWAGAITLFEVARYTPSIPMGEQGLILIPHLAALGIGVGAGGVVVNTFPYTAIGAVHLISSFVFAFGAIFHVRFGPESIGEGSESKFAFSWDDPKQLGLILGHHLLLLGLGALFFVGWIRFHGVYDSTIGDVRIVSNPGATILSVIFEYGWFTPEHNPFFVNNLEDLASGHAFIGVVLLSGGAWHITQEPFAWAQRLLASLFSAEGLLSSALAGLSMLGFAAAYFSAVNTLAYPIEFFGPPLELQFNIMPYFVDSVDLPAGVYSARAWLCNVHFYLAFFVLQGHLWHAIRAIGFDFKKVSNAFATLSN